MTALPSIPAETRHDPSTERVGDGRIRANLSGVSETMLWSLHNRASEAKRHDSVLRDPDSVRIHESIDYDFDGHFGDPCGSLAARAAAIDDVLRRWLERHPDGCVVSLGEGLETQAARVDNGTMTWCSVDLPAAINLREHFLAPTDRFRHVSASVLDPDWLDAVDPSCGVCIIAQGLLMYLEPEFVRRLFAHIARRFPGAEMVFDTIPRWFSDLTLMGLNQTPHYRLPAMPWGIDRNDIEPALRAWRPDVATVRFLNYRAPRGLPRLLGDLMSKLAFARQGVPSLVHLTPTVSESAAPIRRSGARHQAPDLVGDNDSQSRSLYMPSGRKNQPRPQPDPRAMVGVSAMAIQNMSCGDEIARASHRVITKRVKLGIEAAMNPHQADHVEFTRIIPEKVEAFAAAGKVMMLKSGEANRQILAHVSAEVMTAASAALSMSQCANPADLAAAQGRFASAWMGRATSHILAMGLFAMRTQAAALAPIRRTVVENSQRLAE